MSLASIRKEYGSDQKHFITSSVLALQLAHTKYISNLPLFYQYMIWRYTIGSGQVNAYLIFNKLQNPTNAVYWVYQFFDFYNYPISEIKSPFNRYSQFFQDPQSFMNHPNKLQIAEDVIRDYIGKLEELIAMAPKTEGTIQVYKVSSEYPGLPSKTPTSFKPTVVEQMPFNSTTYDLSFNFAPFTAEESDCCFYNITIPEGSSVLLIPPTFHAYPFENEILLPPGVAFDIQSRQDITLDYVPATNKLFEQIQKKPYHIGQVFEEISYGKAAIKKKKMNLFNTVLVNV